MTLLAGRRGLVVGIANRRSLGFGIAKTARTLGAEVLVTYQNERLRRHVEEAAAEIGARVIGACDLSCDRDTEDLGPKLREYGESLDFVVHAVAHAKHEELGMRFLETSREGFALALDVSVYSLIGLARSVLPLLARGRGSPSILTLSFLGSERVVPNYNVMGVAKAALEATVRYLAHDLGGQGVRVNALSPGPMRTLSAAGVRGFRSMLALVESLAPLQRNVTLEDVGGAAAFLLSDLAAAVTGEVLYVDAGYHVMGAPGIQSTSEPLDKETT